MNDETKLDGIYLVMVNHHNNSTPMLRVLTVHESLASAKQEAEGRSKLDTNRDFSFSIEKVESHHRVTVYPAQNWGTTLADRVRNLEDKVYDLLRKENKS